MIVNCFEDLAIQAKRFENKAVIAVVEAQDEHTLESVVYAAGMGIMTPKLIGDAEKIKAMIMEIGAEPSSFEIHASGSIRSSLMIASDMINAGDATALMKGKLETGEFIKAIVSKENNLVEDGLISLAGLYELPKYHKMLTVSDIGLIMRPGLDEKKAIIRNAVDMLTALGKTSLKVAVLAAVEKVNPRMPETVDADELVNMNKRGEITSCVIDGPVSFDLATSAKAAKIKGYNSPVAGDADLLIVPDFVSGNILVKCLTGFAGSITAGAVLGAKVPVILTSRSADASDKFYSIALGACLCGVRITSEKGLRHER